LSNITMALLDRPRLLHFEDVNYLLRLVNHHPDWFLISRLYETRYKSLGEQKVYNMSSNAVWM
jgi:hypothetical protein